MSDSEGNWGLKNGLWLALSAVALGAVSMGGFNVVAGVLLVVVLVLTYLTGREIFTGQGS